MSKKQQIKVGGKNTGKITQSEPEAVLAHEEWTPESETLDTEEEASGAADSAREVRLENKGFTHYETKSREIKLQIEGYSPHYESKEIKLSDGLDNP